LASHRLRRNRYDAENRLITAAKPGMAAVYDYDPLGRRQGKSVNGTVTKFLSDGAEEIAEHDGAAGDKTSLRYTRNGFAEGAGLRSTCPSRLPIFAGNT
jgi:YD repeat-containing protein